MQSKNIKFSKNTKIFQCHEIGLSKYGGSFLPVESISNNHIIVCKDDGESIFYDGAYQCREDFHDQFFNKNQKLKYLIFSHNNKFDSIKTFLQIIERKLKVAARSQSEFYNLQPKNLLIKISDWWNVNTARQQFFTILLRAAAHFDIKSQGKLEAKIEETLKKERYFQETFEVVKLFLDGYNKLKNPHTDFWGWSDYLQENFDYKDHENPGINTAKKLFKK